MVILPVPSGARPGQIRGVKNRIISLLLPISLALLVLPFVARAQANNANQNAPGRYQGPRGGGPQAPEQRSGPSLPLPKLQDPWPRLDVGALLCGSEAGLIQHQAAVEARLNGQDANEPIDCRIVRAMTPVTVVDRHGLSRTEVKLPGPPESTGWTDVVIAREKPRDR